jgi:hypothetical protein
MDIAALVSYPIEPTSSLSMSSPVKEEATVSLWRLAGGKVWAVDLPGRVEGLGWSSDGESEWPQYSRKDVHALGGGEGPGLHLAVYLPGKLVVLSVHDGAVVKAVDISLPPPMYGFAKGKERALENVSIDWREVELPGKWPKPGQAASSAGQKRQEEVVSSRVELSSERAVPAYLKVKLSLNLKSRWDPSSVSWQLSLLRLLWSLPLPRRRRSKSRRLCARIVRRRQTSHSYLVSFPR